MDPRILLKRKISEVSEAAYSAGWHAGLEYDLWGVLQGTGCAPIDLMLGSSGAPDFATLDELADLAVETGGWIAFHPDHGPHFVPLATWLRMFRAVSHGEHPTDQARHIDDFGTRIDWSQLP